MTHALVAIASVVTIVVVLIDAFEAVLQPRRVTHRFRIARLFFRTSWQAWRMVATQFRRSHRREAFLSFFGPLSLIMLFGIWFATLDFRLCHAPLGRGDDARVRTSPACRLIST